MCNRYRACMGGGCWIVVLTRLSVCAERPVTITSLVCHGTSGVRGSPLARVSMPAEEVSTTMLSVQFTRERNGVHRTTVVTELERACCLHTGLQRWGKGGQRLFLEMLMIRSVNLLRFLQLSSASPRYTCSTVYVVVLTICRQHLSPAELQH